MVDTIQRFCDYRLRAFQPRQSRERHGSADPWAVFGLCWKISRAPRLAVVGQCVPPHPRPVSVLVTPRTLSDHRGPRSRPRDEIEQPPTDARRKVRVSGEVRRFRVPQSL
jgi:hypothetical protein